jgi:surface polysaccharide O-acyltransferase-like enzyme
MSRNLNIELLRCLAMLGVVFLHCSNYPYKGLAGASVVDDFLITLFHSISWASVNILVLITGYFTMTSESGRFFKFRKMTKMYFQMWFYALVFFLIGKYILGSDSSLTPLSSGMWWYMTEYFKLMLIAPFIVRAVQSIDRQQYLVMTALFVIVFGVIHLVADGGFGFLWFVTLFLVGGV